MKLLLTPILVVATLCSNVSADAGSLRASLLDSLKANLNTQTGRPAKCNGIVGQGKLQDRYCSSSLDDISNRPDSTGCKEQCHIWGDPHVEAFFTGCDVVTLKESGYYSFLHLEGKNNKKLSIVGKVKSYGKGNNAQEFVEEVRINDKVYLEKDMCEKPTEQECEDGSSQGPHSEVIEYFQITPKDYPNEVVFKVTMYCTEMPRTHVNVIVEAVDDHVTEPGISSSSKETTVPVSLAMFPEAAGACINPCNGEASFLGEDRTAEPTRTLEMDSTGKKDCKAGNGWVWDRQFGTNACPERPGAIDGRVCTASGQCAVHGDPYVVDMFRKMPENDGKMCETKGGTKSECFEIVPRPEPNEGDYQDNLQRYNEERVLALESREFYMVPQEFQAQMTIDECLLVTEFTASYLKIGANKNRVYTSIYNAADLCDGRGENPDGPGFTGHMIKVPGPPTQFDCYEKTDDIKNIIKNDQEFWDENVRGLRLQGVDGDGSFNPGYLVVNLKCHKTKKTNRNEPSYYFNICMERDGVQNLNEDGEPTNEVDLLSVENRLLSRGACATGAERGTANTIDPFDPIEFDFESKVNTQGGEQYKTHGQEFYLGQSLKDLS